MIAHTWPRCPNCLIRGHFKHYKSVSTLTIKQSPPESPKLLFIRFILVQFLSKPILCLYLCVFRFLTLVKINAEEIEWSWILLFYQLFHMCAMLSHSVMSNFLQPQGLQLPRLLCPWGFSRQECWSGLPSPPPGDLPTQISNPGFHIAGR